MIDSHEQPIGTPEFSPETIKTHFLTLILLLDEITKSGNDLIEGMRPAGSSGVQVLVRTKDIVRLAKAVKSAGQAAIELKPILPPE